MNNMMSCVNIDVVRCIHIKLLHNPFIPIDHLTTMFDSILSAVEEAVCACTLYPSEIVCPAHWAEWESEVHATVG